MTGFLIHTTTSRFNIYFTAYLLAIFFRITEIIIWWKQLVIWSLKNECHYRDRYLFYNTDDDITSGRECGIMNYQNQIGSSLMGGAIRATKDGKCIFLLLPVHSSVMPQPIIQQSSYVIDWWKLIGTRLHQRTDSLIQLCVFELYQSANFRIQYGLYHDSKLLAYCWHQDFTKI